MLKARGRLQGKVLGIEKRDERGKLWKKCIFTVKLTGFSKRTPSEIIPPKVKGKEIKLVRWCCFDWHYELDVRKTLEPDETEVVTTGDPTATVYWRSYYRVAS